MEDMQSETKYGKVSRRFGIKLTGVLIGGTQLFGGGILSKIQATKEKVKIVSGAERDSAVQRAVESEKVSRLRNKLNDRKLSISEEDGIVYAISTNKGDYTVVSLFPTYPNQGTRCLGTNLAVALDGDVVRGVTTTVSEFKGRTPTWIHNYVLTEDSVEILSNKIKKSKQGNLVSDAGTMRGAKQLAKAHLKGLNSLDVKPGTAVLPYLTEIDDNYSQKALSVASSVAHFTARANDKNIRA
jgi:hypothetical protein